MNVKKISLAIIIVIGVIASPSPAGEPEKPDARITYLGIRNARLIHSGETIRVAVFRIHNDAPYPIMYLDAHGRPDILVQRSTEDGWKIALWSWCGNGKRPITLEPSTSQTWYIDPAYYSGRFGQRLRFGVGVTPANGHSDTEQVQLPALIWSDPVELPRTEKAPKVEFSGKLYRIASEDGKWQRAGATSRKD